MRNFAAVMIYLLPAVAASQAPQAGRTELANNQVVAALDSKGRLVELTNRQTGSRFRATCADVLLEGRFVDNEGFMTSNSRIAAHAFVTGNRMAVALWNPTEAPQKARVTTPGYTIETAQWQNPAWSGPDHPILPNDVAVLIFSRRQGGLLR
jgi:hypothetical protein